MLAFPIVKINTVLKLDEIKLVGIRHYKQRLIESGLTFLVLSTLKGLANVRIS